MQIQIQWIWGLICSQEMLLVCWPPQSRCEMKDLGPHCSSIELETVFHQDLQMILTPINDYTRSPGVGYKKKACFDFRQS